MQGAVNYSPTVQPPPSLHPSTPPHNPVSRDAIKPPVQQPVYRQRQSRVSIARHCTKRLRELRPVGSSPVATPLNRDTLLADAPKKSGGKPQGSISKTWRSALDSVYRSGRAVTYAQLAKLAEDAGGPPVTLSSVRDRVRYFVRNDILTGNHDFGFSVTENAAKRYGFAKTIEPLNGDTGSGSIGGGYQPPLDLNP